MIRRADERLPITEPVGDIRTGMDVASLRQAFLDNLFCLQGRTIDRASRHDLFMAMAYTVRDRILYRAMQTTEHFNQTRTRLACYLSAEFLLGPLLGANLINLGLYQETQKALADLGIQLEDLLAEEEEPGLGNGGLGRLAACFLDSLATLEIPAIGYGVRYEFGIFDQTIRDGWQNEITDKWLASGNPWELVRPEITYTLNLGGSTRSYRDEQGRYRVEWVPERQIKGVAYDTPMIGYHSSNCILLRLWKAEAVESFDPHAFNRGDYYQAVDDKMFSETISKVLYPNDEPAKGKYLRLAQQYFFVACSLRDMIRIHLSRDKEITTFHEKFAVQLNDTHPAIGIAELMRLLIDEHGLAWEQAWEITGQTFSYTNHTLLPEALEKWPISMFERLLPRHLEIIYEINRRFLEEVRGHYPNDERRIASLSLIDETPPRYVRMANLASLGSHAINGVAQLHSHLLQQSVLRDFHELFPKRFYNVTNGVTPRRWMVLANPLLCELISSHIGENWVCDLGQLRRLEPLAEDPGFQKKWRQVKQHNKERLAKEIARCTGVPVDPHTLFDVQVKRIHEYKRQHLNALHILTLYQRLKQNPALRIVPRTFIFGGKAAPGYTMAKLIIKLINSLGEVINADPAVRGQLTVVFYPDFNVKSGQMVYPAAELSEQISTAGMEASGTGNMKFAMNGALTIGTLDGANIEIREEVGAENFFLFGLTAEQVQKRKRQGYNPRDIYFDNAHLRDALDGLLSGQFSHGDTNLFRPLVDNLLNYDPFMVLADYQAYLDCQQQVDDAAQNAAQWTRMSILNTARMGKFSSDRSINEYCQNIWQIAPCPVMPSEPLPTRMGKRLSEVQRT